MRHGYLLLTLRLLRLWLLHRIEINLTCNSGLLLLLLLILLHPELITYVRWLRVESELRTTDSSSSTRYSSPAQIFTLLLLLCHSVRIRRDRIDVVYRVGIRILNDLGALLLL